MMDQVFKVLVLEDLSEDQILLKRQISKFLPNAIFSFANSKESFLEKINWKNYDLILSDYHIPGYNGLQALLLVKEKMPHVPFVFVTGTLNNEEEVAQAILNGASGYILKGNLSDIESRLTPIIEKSIATNDSIKEKEKKRLRKARLEQKLYTKIEQLPYSTQKEELISIIEDIVQLA